MDIWQDNDFVRVEDLRRAFGYLAHTAKATLSLQKITIGGNEAKSSDIKVVEVELLRTDDDCIATVEPGGSCTLYMPAGVQRPPFVRIRVLDSMDFTEHEGDVRLPQAASGELRGAQLMTAAPATISFGYSITDHDVDQDDVDWKVVWSCLPVDFDADGRLDKAEMESWLAKMRETLSASTYEKAAAKILEKIPALRFSSRSGNNSAETTPNQTPNVSRKNSLDQAVLAVKRLLPAM